MAYGTAGAPIRADITEAIAAVHRIAQRHAGDLQVAHDDRDSWLEIDTGRALNDELNDALTMLGWTKEALAVELARNRVDGKGQRVK